MNDEKIKDILTITINMKEGSTILELIQKLKEIKYLYGNLKISTSTSIAIGNLTAKEVERIYNE